MQNHNAKFNFYNTLDRSDKNLYVNHLIFNYKLKHYLKMIQLSQSLI
jgi:hypothetical protein